MYINNGYVYGGEPKTGLKVISVKALDDMMLILTFNNGETRLFDATVLEGPVFEPLKNDLIFKKAEVDHGVVTWNEGDIDCSPEFMYENSYEYSYIA